MDGHVGNKNNSVLLRYANALVTARNMVNSSSGGKINDTPYLKNYLDQSKSQGLPKDSKESLRQAKFDAIG